MYPYRCPFWSVRSYDPYLCGPMPFFKRQKEFTMEQATEIGKKLGIDFKLIDQEQFRMGLGVELEHGTRFPQANVTNDDPLLTGKIAYAHLLEIPDYYTRLAQMEKAAKD